MAGTLLFYIHEIDFVYRNGNLARIVVSINQNFTGWCIRNVIECNATNDTHEMKCNRM